MPYRYLRILNYLVLSISILALGMVGFFLYHRVYQALDQIQPMLLQRSEVKTETIDFDRLERIAKRWNEKHATTTLAISRDPFAAIPTTTSTSIQETKKKSGRTRK